MPFKNLPNEAFKIWEEVYKKNKDKLGEQRAAKAAWGAVKQAGWKKGKDGKWTKKADLAEFSLTIKKAYYDEKTQTMRWRADASDIDDDSYTDNMSLELFADFLSRIETKEPVPEQFRSDFWSGGIPYLSVSHFRDQNGNAVPGDVETVYVDGKFLKSKGTFHDTPLGRACFKALCEDLSGGEEKQKVRVSIAFLDYMHKHKGEGYIFERKSSHDICPECLRELLEQKYEGKTYLKGHLIHLALTRVPVNKRTSMEVELSMTTQTEDAASIVGEELAKELDDKEKALVGKSEVLVTRADNKCPECGADMKDGECTKCGYTEDESSEEKKAEVAPVAAEPAPIKEESEFDKIMAALSEMKSALSVPRSESSVAKPAHILDETFNQFKRDFDSVMLSDTSPDEKLQSLQGAFDIVANKIIEQVKSLAPDKSSPAPANDLVQALSQAIAPLAQKLDLISTQLTAQVAPKQLAAAPAPRSIDPRLVQQAQTTPTNNSPTPKLRELINRMTQ